MNNRAAKQRRQANLRIANRSDSRRVAQPIPFQCECGDPDCHEFAPVELGEFNDVVASFEPLLAPGHGSTSE